MTLNIIASYVVTIIFAITYVCEKGLPNALLILQLASYMHDGL